MSEHSPVLYREDRAGVSRRYVVILVAVAVVAVLVLACVPVPVSALWLPLGLLILALFFGVGVLVSNARIGVLVRTDSVTIGRLPPPGRLRQMGERTPRKQYTAAVSDIVSARVLASDDPDLPPHRGPADAQGRRQGRTGMLGRGRRGTLMILLDRDRDGREPDRVQHLVGSTVQWHEGDVWTCPTQHPAELSRAVEQMVTGRTGTGPGTGSVGG